MKTLKQFDFGSQAIVRKQYDWNTMLDGQIRVLEAGKDFSCKPATIKTQARAVAKKLGLSVRIGSTDDGNVVIQAYKSESEKQSEPTSKADSGRRQ